MAKIKKPFFIVNPKSYLYGDDVVKLAKIADKVASQYHLDCLFTGQLIDLPRIKAATTHLTITAQHMDPLHPGRGMGHVLPEALKAAGVEAVVLNHAEKPLGIGVLDQTITRAKAVGLMTIVCSDTPSESKAIATLHPTMMICEPTSLIGTGSISNGDYIKSTNEAVRRVDPDILIMQAAGVSTGEDVKKVLQLGADGTGGTSGIIEAPDWQAKLEEMMGAMAAYKEAQLA
ncbi:triose-phosphate isomerase [Lacticaseibacillus chiayiensis]|uniref:Triose-phosphate isomerase n=1 Tax=Lacticaseibacillus chiayiensis TaxID=2100821 RepID=A0A4Q1UF38_9LACO|nr:triose-phosphate isomerase [Lacticaseibacillus chiayiensis]RXT30726.1 triose-phosphate isomerase [Lacticaseibacillus chiayiensis]UYN56316.1 triose-phosphate isomerase [Lacticaseibacillus chiayiensis]